MQTFFKDEPQILSVFKIIFLVYLQNERGSKVKLLVWKLGKFVNTMLQVLKFLQVGIKQVILKYSKNHP